MGYRERKGGINKGGQMTERIKEDEKSPRGEEDIGGLPGVSFSQRAAGAGWVQAGTAKANLTEESVVPGLKTHEHRLPTNACVVYLQFCVSLASTCTKKQT